ncbi:cuticle protein CP14.6-like [Lycorma delicatula]|uniref:cuticle protein CP14.6-like n=1 Tax=Lycorma delicatula TaxID=130591 RepID=UPI003F515748
MIALVLLAVVLGVCSAQIAPAPVVGSPYYKPAAAAYAGQYPQAYAAILRQNQDVSFDGSFNYGFETENGIASQASGILQNPGTEIEAQVQSGSYSYTSPDGTPITVNWVADENGFRADGAHIPQPSPEIQRSVQYNLAQAAAAPVIPGAAAPFRYPSIPAIARTK